VLAIVLALASAIGYGGSDFAAGLASRDVSVISVTLLATVVSTVVVAAALSFAASPGPSAAALAWGGFRAGRGGGVRAAVHRARPGGFGQRDVAGRGGRGWRTGRGGRGGGAGWAGGPAHGGGRGVFRLADSRARLLAVVTGAAGAAGTILFFFATHQGFLAVTAVLTSLYPAVTIVLARTVLGERLTAMRLGGLALAGICVSLIAVGGAS
jgi:hypothetical protein